MCLVKYCTENCLEEAKENIICYKILKYLKGKYISPYQDFNYTEYVNDSGKIFEEKGKENIVVFANSATIIDKGFIHFYSHVSHHVKDKMKHFFGEEGWCLFKCIIPKGTTIIRGDDGTICAKKFRFVEEIQI